MTEEAASALSATSTYSGLMAVYAIWQRELKRVFRDRGQLVGGLSRPLMWLLIMGIGLSPYFRGEVYGQVSFAIPYTYMQFIFPAIIALNILYTSVQSAISIVWDREFGVLREVLVSPNPRWVILAGKVLGGATAATGHGLIVVCFAYFSDVDLSILSVLEGLVLMFTLAFVMTCFGVVVASTIRGLEAFGLITNVVILPLYFTSSSVFPLDPGLTTAQASVIYPEPLVVAVRLNPITYAVDALRSAFIGFNQFDLHIDIAVLIGMTLVLFLLALWRFSHMR